MLVKEKYANELIEFAINRNEIAVDKDTKQITSCSNLACSQCLFDVDDNGCLNKAQKYFNTEYIEEPLLSDIEYIILKNIENKWKYITRDKSTGLYLHDMKPCKMSNHWCTRDCGSWENFWAFKHLFQFLQWTDKEPYLIEDLLKDYESKKGKNNENSK